MKYIIENWMTEETIKVFSTYEEREEWMDDNCVWFSDGCFIKDTDIKICCYETR